MRGGIVNMRGWISRISMAIATAGLLLGPVARAAEADLTQKMPHGYLGEFRWDGDKTAQNVVIVFDSVGALNKQNAEAVGCGTYEVGRSVTSIKVRMLVQLSDLRVEIFELSPEGNGAFETRGSHRGKLSKDFQRIDATWTTTVNGKQGHLHLHAASSLACAPAASA